jgi:hypothetical protein
MRRAYSDLSQAKKDQIEDLVIEHECVFSRLKLAIWNSRSLDYLAFGTLEN